MSEIEKMYANCGIYPDCRARECGLDYCANSSGCGYAVYPDFTAEKQLRILKCLTVNRGILIKQNVFFTNIENPKNVIGTENIDSNFEEGFASLINILWQSFTEEEKQQVKGILE